VDGTLDMGFKITQARWMLFQITCKLLIGITVVLIFRPAAYTWYCFYRTETSFKTNFKTTFWQLLLFVFAYGNSQCRINSRVSLCNSLLFI